MSTTLVPAPDGAEGTPLNKPTSDFEPVLSLLHRRLHGSLATMARQSDVGPLGSVVPYALDARGRAIIYVATISEHRRNLLADPRASLLVHDEPRYGHDVQAQARVCLMGSAQRAADEERDGMWRRYLARNRSARGYEQTHDFELWILTPARLRWIGGFGDIRWLSCNDYESVSGLVQLENAAGVVEHMNEDHRDAIETFYRAGPDREAPPDVSMVGVDSYGMDFDSSAGPMRVPFLEPASPDTVRVRVIDALRAARQRLGA